MKPKKKPSKLTESKMRKMIREEVQTVLYEFLAELVDTKTTEPPKQSVVQPPRAKPVQQEQKQFTTNPVLNDILNETSGMTAESLTENVDDDWDTVSISNSGITSAVNSGDIRSDLRSKFSNILSAEGVSPLASPGQVDISSTFKIDQQNTKPEVLDALNRDYSELVKRF